MFITGCSASPDIKPTYQYCGVIYDRYFSIPAVSSIGNHAPPSNAPIEVIQPESVARACFELISCASIIDNAELNSE